MTKQENKANLMVVSAKQISEILKLSDRRIRQLAEEGWLVRVSHGKFNLP